MSSTALTPAQQQRVAALEQSFDAIARTRMQGVPVLHAPLQVQAVAFQVVSEEGRDMLVGILITPWFMNLLRLPVLRAAPGAGVLAVGKNATHAVGEGSFDFIGAFEESLGAFEACSLFSPMFEFCDQEAAVATAREVLSLLRTPPPELPPAPQKPAASLAIPSRRGFLFGRGAQGARV